MYIPLNLRYTIHHLWLRPVGRNDIYIGITDYAQKELGRIDSLDIQGEGAGKTKGALFGRIFGTNKTLELITPFTGIILMLNADLEKKPSTLNSGPYLHWIALMSIGTKHFQGMKMLSAEEYKNKIRQQLIKL